MKGEGEDLKQLYVDFRDLYESGRYQEIIDKYLLSTQVSSGILKFVGLAYYRLANYEKCKEIISMQNRKDSVELRAIMAAYVDKDEKQLLAVYAEAPHNLGVVNALVISARNKGSKINKLTVYKAIESAKDDSRVSANILHNAGRYFLEKEDYHIALGFFSTSFCQI